MRLAILLNGGWRGVSWNIAQYNLKLFEKYNPDYFVHTWDSYNGKHIAQSINNIPAIDTDDVEYNVIELRNRIKELYEPVHLQIDSSNKMHYVFAMESNGCDTSGWVGWWSAWEANNLKRMHEQHGEFKYDVVIRLRPDVLFTKNQEINVHNKIEYVLNNKNVIFTHYVNDNSRILTQDIFPVIDYYHISTSDIIDWLHNWVYLKTYNKQENLRNYIVKRLNNIEFNPPIPEHATPVLLRELFADDAIVDIIYNNFDNKFSLIGDIYKFISLQGVETTLNPKKYYESILPPDNLLIKSGTDAFPKYFFDEESQSYTRNKIKQLFQENSYD